VGPYKQNVDAAKSNLLQILNFIPPSPRAFSLNLKLADFVQICRHIWKEDETVFKIDPHLQKQM
jgi:hypothetical protein